MDAFRPAEKSVRYLTAKFHFLTDEWKEGTLKLRARSSTESVVHEADIIDGVSLIPWEAIQKNGTFFVSIYNHIGDVEITTNRVEVSLNATLPGGSETRPPTPTELDRIWEEIEQLREDVDNFEPGGSGGGTSFKPDETLSLKDGVLSVNTTDQVEQDNTLPITSAGVYATVGNIEALLKTI